MNLIADTIMTELHESTPAVTWTGRILSGLVIAFLLLDGSLKLVPIQPVSEAMLHLGFDSTDALARGLGTLLIACTLLYAVPRTALIGAILLTGYLGGSIAIHLRIGNPLFTHILFGGYLGVLLWIGLLARSARLRALIFNRAVEVA